LTSLTVVFDTLIVRKRYQPFGALKQLNPDHRELERSVRKRYQPFGALKLHRWLVELAVPEQLG